MKPRKLLLILLSFLLSCNGQLTGNEPPHVVVPASSEFFQKPISLESGETPLGKFYPTGKEPNVIRNYISPTIKKLSNGQTTMLVGGLRGFVTSATLKANGKWTKESFLSADDGNLLRFRNW